MTQVAKLLARSDIKDYFMEQTHADTYVIHYLKEFLSSFVAASKDIKFLFAVCKKVDDCLYIAKGYQIPLRAKSMLYLGIACNARQR